MDSETTYVPSPPLFEYPQELLDEISHLRCEDGKIYSRKILQAFNIVKKYEIPHLANFQWTHVVQLVSRGWKNFGKCKICENLLDYEKYKRKTTYCCQKCYKADPAAGRKISKRKTELYADPEWKAQTEAKKTATCMENHGVLFPMQSKELHEKQQGALGCIKEHKGFRIRGFEDKFIDWCEAHSVDISSDLVVPKTAFQYFDPVEKKTRTYHPDFYIPSRNLFVEVKSEYTISKACNTAREIEYKLKAVREQGCKIILVVMSRTGEIQFPEQYN